MNTTPPRKKLIEVSLPLAAINTAGARETSIRHGHPATLHLLGDGWYYVAEVLGTPEQTEVSVEYRWNNNKNHPILIAVFNGFVVWVVGEVID